MIPPFATLSERPYISQTRFYGRHAFREVTYRGSEDIAELTYNITAGALRYRSRRPIGVRISGNSSGFLN
jgi:hypothetical protein